MEDYIFKSLAYYSKIKKLYNSEKLNVIWHKEGAPSTKIGKCMDSFSKWISSTNDKSYQNFGGYYLKNTKTIDTLKKLAIHLQKLYKNITEDEKILNLDNILDLIIMHGVVETYNGGMIELNIESYLKKRNRYCEKDESLDRLYGIDIITESRDKSHKVGIQIKPISFFLSQKQDVIIDRKKAFTCFDNLLNSDNPFNIKELYFVIYKKIENEIYYYYCKKSNIFHKFPTLDEAMSHNWHNICKKKENWIKLS